MVPRIIQLTITCLLLFFFTADSCANEICTFSSRTYSVGEIWYSRLGQRGALYCVACLCQEGGKINCTIHQCGQDCASTASKNECCLFCSKEPRAMMTAPSSPSVAEAALTVPPISSTKSRNKTSSSSSSINSKNVSSFAERETSNTCVHNGNVYNHKERFSSSSIGLKPEHPNQCVQCACEAGMVLCQLRDCVKPECEKPIRTGEDCCPVCPDPAGRMDEMDNSPVLIQQPDTKMEDCISGGRYYLHGTTWHPVMGPFGPMDCVNCVCKSGSIECHRLECSNQRSLNCDKPVKVTGRCCPVCPLQGDNQGTLLSVSSSSPMTRDATPRSSSSSMSHFRDSKTHLRTSSASRVLPPIVTPIKSNPVEPPMCLPELYDMIVYRAQGGGNSSTFIQYIFQKVVNGNAIEHHLWMLQPSLTTYKVQDLEFSHLEALRQRFRFVFLGATTTKNLKRFTKREKKLKPKCSLTSGCPKKIRRLERNLSLKEVTHSKECPRVESK